MDEETLKRFVEANSNIDTFVIREMQEKKLSEIQVAEILARILWHLARDANKG